MLQLLNKTAFETGVGLLTDQHGRESVCIAIKGTFTIPASFTDELTLAEEQLPVLTSDEYYGEPGKSSVKYPADVILGKTGTDIGLVGSAYSKDDAPTEKLKVSIRVGNLKKTIQVFGNRYWKKNKFLPGLSISKPELFTKMPLLYERAFGGADTSHEDKEKHTWYRKNPIGTGFKTNRHALENCALPNFEDPDNLISHWKNIPEVMGYGFIDSSWEPRITYAGTYDDAWQKNQSPLLPKDFKIDFFNAASRGLRTDQVIQEEQNVELINVSPTGLIEFTLPSIKINATFHTNEDAAAKETKLWTILFEPDKNRFYLVWGESFPIGKQPSKMRYIEVAIQGESAFSKEVEIEGGEDGDTDSDEV
ncbi:MAG: DUF2169 domain-containing protein [Chitinispirillia bacterium]|jgi:hypothetical protein